MLLKLLIAAKFVLQMNISRYHASTLTTRELITSRSTLTTSAMVCDVSVDKSVIKLHKMPIPTVTTLSSRDISHQTPFKLHYLLDINLI